MKLSLGLLTILFLALGAIACSGSPDALMENGSSIDGNSTFSKVALDVPTIT